MAILNPDTITALFSGVGVILGAIASLVGVILWGKRKEAKKRPLDSGDLYVRQCECAQHRAAIAKRIDELGPALERIFKKLSDNDKRSEERANQMHRRIDPLIERTAANAQAIEMLRDERKGQSR